MYVSFASKAVSITCSIEAAFRVRTRGFKARIEKFKSHSLTDKWMNPASDRQKGC